MKNRIEETRDQLGAVWDSLVQRTGIRVITDRLPHPASNSVVTLDLQGYRQVETYTCGFVAGLMVLHVLRPEASAEEFYRTCKPDSDIGMGTSKLVRALRKSKIGVSERRDLEFSDIQNAIDSGYPIITSVTTRREQSDHWVVIYGYGVDPDRLFIAGNGIPHLGNSKKFRFDSFSSKFWSPEGFGLVCWGKG